MKPSIRNQRRALSVSGALMLAITSGLVLYSRPSPAPAVVCTNCATLTQQAMQLAKEVQTAMNTYDTMTTVMDQYQDMLTQAKDLPNSIFESLQSDLRRIEQLYQQGQSIAYTMANVEQQFRKDYPDYEKYLNKVTTSKYYPQQYRDWAKAGFDNARIAIQAAGINVNSMADEDTLLDNLVQRSANAEGRMQAIQAGNEIAAQQVQQMQKLREMIATSITLQSNYYAQQTQRQVTDDAFAEQYKSQPLKRTPVKGY